MNLDEARRKVLGWEKPPKVGLSLPAISYRKPVNCIAFYKGERISDHILDWAIELATYGYITEAGKQLYLIPINLYKQATRDQQAKADEYARLRRRYEPNFKSGPASPSIKKWDCITLKSFLPDKSSGSRARLCESRVLSPLIPRPPGGTNRNAGSRHQVHPNRNAICLYCDEVMTPKRKDAKYCGQACKQAAYRESKRK